MTSVRIILVALATTVALGASACGGGSGEVPEGAVAVVDGTVIQKSELDELVAIAKKAYEGTQQDFPKAGTPEYQSIQTRYVALLVERATFQREAEELGIEVTDADVDAAIDEVVKSRFEGKRAELDEALEQAGMSLEVFRKTMAASVLSQKLFDHVTKEVEVTEADLLAYYTRNQASYTSPTSREVRHILIAEKGPNGGVDYAKSKREADRIHRLLLDGADFAALAKKHSADPGSKDSGGKYTAVRGASVPEFDRMAFRLRQGEISEPVKTQFGYHVIEALSPKPKVQPFGEVRAGIRTALLQERRTEVMTKWVEDLRKRYESEISYAEGFHPPELPEAPTGTETE